MRERKGLKPPVVPPPQSRSQDLQRLAVEAPAGQGRLRLAQKTQRGEKPIRRIKSSGPEKVLSIEPPATSTEPSMEMASQA
jgi:hypothetical protein